MPRTKRIVFNGGFYHVFNRGLQKQKIFLSTGDFLKFSHKTKELLQETDLAIYCYAFMPNHFHFLIETRKNSLANFMRRLLTSYAVYFNNKYEHSGPVFQDRFKSIVVQKNNYFMELSRYIHLNPFKAGLVNDPRQYQFSSLAEIIGDKPESIINKEKVGRLIGSSKTDKNQYINFIYAGLNLDLSEFDPWLKPKDSLGSRRYITNRIKKYR